MRSNSNIDRKRAASGERDDEAMVATAGRLTLPKPKVQYVDCFGAPSTPREIRVIQEGPYQGNFDMTDWLISKEKADSACFACRHVSKRREIVAKFGKTTLSKLAMSLGHVRVTDLSQDPLLEPLSLHSNPIDNVVPLQRVEDMLHVLTVDRNDIVDVRGQFSDLTVEVSFYSRIHFDYIEEHSDLRLAPLGKAKLFFPKQHSKMLVHLDMLRFS